MIKLKVGLVLDDSLDRNDGVQQYVRQLGGWLLEQGHDVHYLAGQTEATDGNVHSLSRNLNVRFNGNHLSTPISVKADEIRKLLDQEQFDVLHVQMPFSPLMAGKVIKAASPETAVIGTFHILPYGGFSRLSNKALGVVQKRAITRFDALSAVSQPAADFAEELYGRSADEVLPFMIDRDAWQSSEEPKTGRVVFLGRLEERKGCLQLLQAIETMPEIEKADVEVLIGGKGPERAKLEKYAQQRGLPVTFLGFVDPEEVASLLASANLAIFPALSGESFGIVLVEAMAARAGAVIGGDNPGYRSVLGEWPDALVDPTDAMKFGGHIRALLTDKKRVLELHEKQQSAVKQYDASVVGPKVLQLYTGALSKRRKS